MKMIWQSKEEPVVHASATVLPPIITHMRSGVVWDSKTVFQKLDHFVPLLMGVLCQINFSAIHLNYIHNRCMLYFHFSIPAGPFVFSLPPEHYGSLLGQGN